MAYATDFSDGASDYAAADVLKVWTSGSISSIGTSDDDGGTLVNPVGLLKSGLNESTYRIVGFRMMPTATSGSVEIFRFTGPGGGDHSFIRRRGDGTLEFLGEGFTIFGQDATTPVGQDSWTIIEAGLFISDTVGLIEVRINGTQIAALTSASLGGSAGDNLNTLNGSSGTTIGGVAFTGGQSCEVDWIWTKWDTGIWSASDFLGNVRKITRRPKASTAGDGFYNAATAWSVGAGSTTLSDVMRDTTMDSDTSYAVRAAVAGDTTDRFSLIQEAMPSNTNVVKLVSHRRFVRNTAGTTSTHKGFVRHSSTNYDSPAYTDGTSYQHRQENYDAAPDATSWTKSKVDALEIGAFPVTLT